MQNTNFKTKAKRKDLTKNKVTPLRKAAAKYSAKSVSSEGIHLKLKSLQEQSRFRKKMDSLYEMTK